MSVGCATNATATYNRRLVTVMRNTLEKFEPAILTMEEMRQEITKFHVFDKVMKSVPTGNDRSPKFYRLMMDDTHFQELCNECGVLTELKTETKRKSTTGKNNYTLWIYLHGVQNLDEQIKVLKFRPRQDRRTGETSEKPPKHKGGQQADEPALDKNDSVWNDDLVGTIRDELLDYLKSLKTGDGADWLCDGVWYICTYKLPGRRAVVKELCSPEGLAELRKKLEKMDSGKRQFVLETKKYINSGDDEYGAVIALADRVDNIKCLKDPRQLKRINKRQLPPKHPVEDHPLNPLNHRGSDTMSGVRGMGANLQATKLGRRREIEANSKYCEGLWDEDLPDILTGKVRLNGVPEHTEAPKFVRVAHAFCMLVNQGYLISSLGKFVWWLNKWGREEGIELKNMFNLVEDVGEKLRQIDGYEDLVDVVYIIYKIRRGREAQQQQEIKAAVELERKTSLEHNFVQRDSTTDRFLIKEQEEQYRITLASEVKMAIWEQAMLAPDVQDTFTKKKLQLVNQVMTVLKPKNRGSKWLFFLGNEAKVGGWELTRGSDNRDYCNLPAGDPAKFHEWWVIDSSELGRVRFDSRDERGGTRLGRGLYLKYEDLANMNKKSWREDESTKALKTEIENFLDQPDKKGKPQREDELRSHCRQKNPKAYLEIVTKLFGSSFHGFLNAMEYSTAADPFGQQYVSKDQITAEDLLHTHKGGVRANNKEEVDKELNKQIDKLELECQRGLDNNIRCCAVLCCELDKRYNEKAFRGIEDELFKLKEDNQPNLFLVRFVNFRASRPLPNNSPPMEVLVDEALKTFRLREGHCLGSSESTARRFELPQEERQQSASCMEVSKQVIKRNANDIYRVVNNARCTEFTTCLKKLSQDMRGVGITVKEEIVDFYTIPGVDISWSALPPTMIESFANILQKRNITAAFINEHIEAAEKAVPPDELDIGDPKLSRLKELAGTMKTSMTFSEKVSTIVTRVEHAVIPPPPETAAEELHDICTFRLNLHSPIAKGHVVHKFWVDKEEPQIYSVLYNGTDEFPFRYDKGELIAEKDLDENYAKQWKKVPVEQINRRDVRRRMTVDIVVEPPPPKGVPVTKASKGEDSKKVSFSSVLNKLRKLQCVEKFEERDWKVTVLYDTRLVNLVVDEVLKELKTGWAEWKILERVQEKTTEMQKILGTGCAGTEIPRFAVIRRLKNDQHLKLTQQNDGSFTVTERDKTPTTTVQIPSCEYFQVKVTADGNESNKHSAKLPIVYLPQSAERQFDLCSGINEWLDEPAEPVPMAASPNKDHNKPVSECRQENDELAVTFPVVVEFKDEQGNLGCITSGEILSYINTRIADKQISPITEGDLRMIPQPCSSEVVKVACKLPVERLPCLREALETPSRKFRNCKGKIHAQDAFILLTRKCFSTEDVLASLKTCLGLDTEDCRGNLGQCSLDIRPYHKHEWHMEAWKIIVTQIDFTEAVFSMLWQKKIKEEEDQSTFEILDSNKVTLYLTVPEEDETTLAYQTRGQYPAPLNQSWFTSLPPSCQQLVLRNPIYWDQYPRTNLSSPKTHKTRSAEIIIPGETPKAAQKERRKLLGDIGKHLLDAKKDTANIPAIGTTDMLLNQACCIYVSWNCQSNRGWGHVQPTARHVYVALKDRQDSKRSQQDTVESVLIKNVVMINTHVFEVWLANQNDRLALLIDIKDGPPLYVGKFKAQVTTEYSLTMRGLFNAHSSPLNAKDWDATYDYIHEVVNETALKFEKGPTITTVAEDEESLYHKENVVRDVSVIDSDTVEAKLPTKHFRDRRIQQLKSARESVAAKIRRKEEISPAESLLSRVIPEPTGTFCIYLKWTDRQPENALQRVYNGLLETCCTVPIHDINLKYRRTVVELVTIKVEWQQSLWEHLHTFKNVFDGAELHLGGSRTFNMSYSLFQVYCPTKFEPEHCQVVIPEMGLFRCTVNAFKAVEETVGFNFWQKALPVRIWTELHIPCPNMHKSREKDEMGQRKKSWQMWDLVPTEQDALIALHFHEKVLSITPYPDVSNEEQRQLDLIGDEAPLIKGPNNKLVLKTSLLYKWFKQCAESIPIYTQENEDGKKPIPVMALDKQIYNSDTLLKYRKQPPNLKWMILPLLSSEECPSLFVKILPKSTRQPIWDLDESTQDKPQTDISLKLWHTLRLWRKARNETHKDWEPAAPLEFWGDWSFLKEPEASSTTPTTMTVFQDDPAALQDYLQTRTPEQREALELLQRALTELMRIVSAPKLAETKPEIKTLESKVTQKCTIHKKATDQLAKVEKDCEEARQRKIILDKQKLADTEESKTLRARLSELDYKLTTARSDHQKTKRDWEKVKEELDLAENKHKQEQPNRTGGEQDKLGLTVIIDNFMLYEQLLVDELLCSIQYSIHEIVPDAIFPSKAARSRRKLIFKSEEDYWHFKIRMNGEADATVFIPEGKLISGKGCAVVFNSEFL